MKAAARSWKMWGHEVPAHDGTIEYHHCGDKRWVEIHGLSYPIVPVVLKESKKGKFLGWLETGSDAPCMIWHEKIFEICFAYGSEVEVKKGRGTVVRLVIERDNER